MQLTSKDGNMVVDFYPVKDWDGTVSTDHKLKVLTFMGNTMRKMILTIDQFVEQSGNYRTKHDYQVTDNLDNLPQFHNFMKSSGCYYKPYRTLNNY
tara:strand:+ start:870 stop:1157 length:288 start_codon:yes stop_codon:yes gene_type:complete